MKSGLIKVLVCMSANGRQSLTAKPVIQSFLVIVTPSSLDWMSFGQSDKLEVHYEDKTYEYEITTTWITDADDRSVIVEKVDPTLTLTTYYPFNYIGYAPNRYIVQATLVE